MAAVLFGLLLVLADRHNRRFDLTPTKSFVLSDEARQVAQGLKVPVRITAFYNTQEGEQRRHMADLLELFHDASPHITYRLLDLDRSPALAKKYDVSSFNTGVIETDGQLRELRSIDEEEITNGLLRLTRLEERTLCFVTGHGEHSPQGRRRPHRLQRGGQGAGAGALRSPHPRHRSAQGVPADCTVVVLPGPSHDFLPGEADQLSAATSTAAAASC